MKSPPFLKYYSSALNSPMEFLESMRSGFSYDDCIPRRGRFKSARRMGWLYRGGVTDCTYFTRVDKDIMLQGLRFFGSENNDYSVSVLKVRG